MPFHKLEYYPLVDGLVESKYGVFTNTEIKNQVVMGLGDEIKAWIFTKKLNGTIFFTNTFNIKHMPDLTNLFCKPVKLS